MTAIKKKSDFDFAFAFSNIQPGEDLVKASRPGGEKWMKRKWQQILGEVRGWSGDWSESSHTCLLPVFFSRDLKG